MREIRSLTAIRGVAAIWVVTHHLALFYRAPHFVSWIWKLLFRGFIGVDIFFVLSGFILTTVYRDLDLGGLKEFALRRILRIYPLHLTVLAVLAVMAYYSIVWGRGAVEWDKLPETALLLQPYLGLTHGFWNPASWSAAVELFCYLVFPAALFLLRRLPALPLIPLVFAAGYGEWYIQTVHPDTWFGWACVERGLAGFAFGMALGLLSMRIKLVRPAVIAVEILSLLVLVWAAMHPLLNLVPLAAGVLIWMLEYEAGPIALLLRTPVPFFLGKISFSIYLIHFPLLEAYGLMWPTVARPPVNLAFTAREAVYFAILFGLSTLTYYIIERPARQLLRAKKHSPALAADVPPQLSSSGSAA